MTINPMGNTKQSALAANDSALAAQIQKYSDTFKHGKRTDGSEYTYLELGAPEALRQSAHDAHDDRVSDDWIYLIYYRILDTLTGYDITTIDDVEEYRREISDGLVDAYNTDRTAWLASHLGNAAWCDEAADKIGPADDGIFAQIGLGQYYAIDQIYGHVVDLLGEAK